jgi:hypothetical protein
MKLMSYATPAFRFSLSLSPPLCRSNTPAAPFLEQQILSRSRDKKNWVWFGLLPEDSLSIAARTDTDDLQSPGGQHVNYNAANGGTGADHWADKIILGKYKL